MGLHLQVTHGYYLVQLNSSLSRFVGHVLSPLCPLHMSIFFTISEYGRYLEHVNRTADMQSSIVSMTCINQEFESNILSKIHILVRSKSMTMWMRRLVRQISGSVADN